MLDGVYANQFDGQAWSGWQGLGGVITSAPVAAFTPSPYVFARGTDGAVWYSVRRGASFDGWRSLGGFIVGTPSVVKSGTLMVFARGGDNALYVNRQVIDDTWTGWQGLGGQLTSDPVAVARRGYVADAQQVQVFARNGGGGVNTRRWTGTFWEAWQDLGGAIQATPAATTIASYNPNYLAATFVFGRGNDDTLQVNQFDGATWSGWQSLGGVLRSDPVAATGWQGLVSDGAYVVVRSTDSGLWLNRWLRWEGWRGWSNLGGATVLAAGLTARYGAAQVFGVDSTTLAAYHRSFS